MDALAGHSGNAISKLLIGPAFGFLAGWMIDRFGPRRVMMAGILMASIALVGLGTVSSLRMFYFFYILNALGFVCGGPLPNQVLLSECFREVPRKSYGLCILEDRHRRGNGAMDFEFLGAASRMAGRSA